MRNSHSHYFTHRGRRAHPMGLLRRITTSIGTPLLLVAIAGVIATGTIIAPHSSRIDLPLMYAALGASLLRLFGAYILSILVGIPLGLLAERSRRFEAFFLPLYDVLESMPVLAFFPVIILFFLQAGWLEGAAIFIIFFSMVWDIAFSVIGGNKVIPKDVQAIGTVFELSRFKRLTTITLPSIFPQLITGSILALANGWNIVIVAEALHAYAPLSLAAQDLFGIGSILVLAASQSDTLTLLTAMGILIGAIALINIAVWQPLLGYSERFKFE